ncbi:hypothetical protein [Streptomyces sp. A5-4]|uniref:hypothetical protein n=1 Tax=Streptomyces sp. A5-4 TaxID=3384771 RepID=UPI003DAA3F1E
MCTDEADTVHGERAGRASAWGMAHTVTACRKQEGDSVPIGLGPSNSGPLDGPPIDTHLPIPAPEVRAAYFSRFAAEHDRAGQLETVKAELLADLGTSTQVFTIVTLVPDLGGGMTIGTATVKAYQEQTVGGSPMIVNGSGINWIRAQLGAGRLTADGSSGPDQKAT